MKYPFNDHMRVVLVPAINNMAAPTLAEIAAGDDVTCDLASDGLALSRSTVTEDRTPWRGEAEVFHPVRYAFNDARLVGYRFTPPDPEVLWDAAVFKAEGYLVVRRGIHVASAFAADQVVETYWFYFGKRSVYDSSGEMAVMFTVPLSILEDDDDAVVTA